MNEKEKTVLLSVPNISGNELKYVKECLETGWISSAGSYVDKFEQMVANYAGTKYGIATMNGTSALHTVLILAGVKPKDYVIVSNMTFVASANSIKYTGADPILIDADLKTWQMDLDLLDEFLDKKTSINSAGERVLNSDGRCVRTIMPVHIQGNIFDVDRFKKYEDKIVYIRINDFEDEFMISSSQMGPFPEELQVGLVNINERKVLLNFLDHKEVIPNNKNSVYDLKVIAGDQEYVKSMSQEILSSIPEEFSLGQNYPNPFNPITQMEYSLPQSSKVIISIYNVLGQEIKTLVNKEQDYGYHSVSWDGTDRLGKSVASGVYFTQMRSDGFSQSKKMLLLK